VGVVDVVEWVWEDMIEVGVFVGDLGVGVGRVFEDIIGGECVCG
jgi:hypothetical protein